MNHTVIDSRKLAKIKKLNNQIEGLRELRTIGVLTPKLLLKLENKENKLSKLLKQL